MGASIKINNETHRHPCGFDIDKMLRKLLSHCEPKHLVGLDKIVILNNFNGSKKDYKAYYSRQHGLSKPSIFLSFDNIFWGKATWPFCFRFVVRVNLARALYHEIGHHYHHTLKHGVKKYKAEEFAVRYQLKMMRKTAPKWRFILYPLHLLILLINKIYTSRT